MLKGSLKKMVILCVVALAGLSQASDFNAPADVVRLKPPISSVADGTRFDWAPGQNFYVSQGAKMTFFSHGFNMFAYSSTSDVMAFGLWNLDAVASDVHTYWQRSWSYAACLTLYNNGRLFLGNSPYPNNADTTANELLSVNGDAKIVNNLDVHSISLGLVPGNRPTAASANIIRPVSTVTEPSTAGAMEGDLTYDSDANPATGSLTGGPGAWVMFDSTPPAAWHVIKTF
jgi:hypothetical protein